MARMNNRTSATPAVRSSTVDSLYRNPTPLSHAHNAGTSTARQSSYSVMSPALSMSSDKENDIPSSREETPELPSRAKQAPGKRAHRPITPDSGSATSGNPNKRRRTDNYAFAEMSYAPIYEDGDGVNEDEVDQEPTAEDDGTPTPPENEEDEALKYYNPDQNPEVRRALVGRINEHHREILDNRDELIKGDGDDLVHHIDRANNLMTKVRQTTDAAKDSRTLLNLADISGRKLTNFAQSRAGIGLDLDQFVSRCIHFMKEGHPPTEEEAAPTQKRNRRQTQAADEEDEDDEETVEELDWAFLGRYACFPCNRRPPVSSFLLGPLSLQKRVRAVQTQRARSQRQPLGPATRPQELRQEDIQQSGNTNLTHLVTTIKSRLAAHINDGTEKIDAELEALEDPDDEDMFAAFSRHRVYQTPNQEPAVSLFDFAVNPNSFGQTVENLFYISFLIREGNAKILVDENELPLLVPAETLKVGERLEQNVEKHQAIFSIDYATWTDLKEAFDIKESLIPHRVPEQTNVAPGGWYG